MLNPYNVGLFTIKIIGGKSLKRLILVKFIVITNYELRITNYELSKTIPLVLGFQLTANHEDHLRLIVRL